MQMASDSPTRYHIVGPEPPMLLSDAIQDAWVAFARSGNPNTGDLPDMPSYDEKYRTTMIFDTGSRVEHDPEKDVRLFFKGILLVQ
jgi:para-nitrobenzyl esterase